MLSIIDTHVHLFPSSHLSSLAWMTPDNLLNSQHSVSEYRAAVSCSVGPQSLRGFVFLETDRISSISQDGVGWKHALDEISFLKRIALGKPILGEGHRADDANLCAGIVPWAPIPGGREVMKKYIAEVKERAGEMWKKVKGFRYLVQDKPKGTMGTKGFGEGLDLLGEEGLVFDLGIDVRGAGMWQIAEASEMVSGVLNRCGGTEENMVTIVLDHMCKPNMSLSPEEAGSSNADFEEWQAGVEALAKYPKSYMKLSGGFSQLPHQDLDRPWSNKEIADQMKPWTDAIFKAFGPRRIMFGSDWPVCNIGGAGNKNAWKNWQSVVQLILEDIDLTEDEKAAVWSETAAKAYNISN